MEHSDALEPLFLIRFSRVFTGEKITAEEVVKGREIYTVILDVLYALGIVPCVFIVNPMCSCALLYMQIAYTSINRASWKNWLFRGTDRDIEKPGGRPPRSSVLVGWQRVSYAGFGSRWSRNQRQRPQTGNTRSAPRGAKIGARTDAPSIAQAAGCDSAGMFDAMADHRARSRLLARDPVWRFSIEIHDNANAFHQCSPYARSANHTTHILFTVTES